jgi:hypothetical protein
MSAPALPQRLWLPCSAEAVPAELDHLCAWLRRKAVPYGYLSLQAPLVTNLTVLENLWLPHAWRSGCSRQAVLKRLDSLQPGVDLPLDRRPAELTPLEVERLVVLRAALGRPRVVVVDPAWTNWTGAISLLELATWWMPAPDLDPLMGAQGWIRMGFDGVCGLLE